MLERYRPCGHDCFYRGRNGNFGTIIADALDQTERRNPDFIEKAHASLDESLKRQKTDQVRAFVGVINFRIQSLAEPKP